MYLQKKKKRKCIYFKLAPRYPIVSHLKKEKEGEEEKEGEREGRRGKGRGTVKRRVRRRKMKK